MALKAVLAKIDDVAEAFREHYKEKDGKFYLDVESVDGLVLENVDGLKTALSTERSTRERLEKEVIKFKDIDPVKAREALQKLEELSALDPTKEADKIANTKFEQAKAQLLATHQTELATRDTRIKFLGDTVDDLVREQKATSAIAAAKGSIDLLLPHVLNHTRTVEKDNKFVVEVVDKAGIVQLDGKGNPITIEDYVTSMKSNDVFARAFDGEGHTGTGKQQDQQTSKIDTKNASMGGSREERRAAIAAKFKLPT